MSRGVFMRRATMLCGLIAVGALAVGLRAFQPPAQQGPKVVEVEIVLDLLDFDDLRSLLRWRLKGPQAHSQRAHRNQAAQHSCSSHEHSSAHPEFQIPSSKFLILYFFISSASRWILPGRPPNSGATF